jgi:hypothetical protein
MLSQKAYNIGLPLHLPVWEGMGAGTRYLIVQR